MSEHNRVSKVNIYYQPGAKPKTDHPSGVPVEFVEGDYAGPVLKNTDIEDPDKRSELAPEEANICIAVQPGEDEIGQLHVCVQYEGKKGLTNECMQGQNDMSAHLGEWLNELFADCEADWDFQIHAEPCPKADEPYRLQEITSRILGQTVKQDVQTEVDIQIKQNRTHQHNVKSGSK